MRVFFIFLLFILPGFFIFFGFRRWQVQRKENIPFIPQKSVFKLSPPSEALRGHLIEVEGEMKKEPREGKDFELIKTGEEILQGEKIQTEKNSQGVVEFADFGKVRILPQSEISLINSIPQSFLIQQVSGEVIYESSSNNPLAVRSLHTLLMLRSGEAKVTLDGKSLITKVDMTSGNGQIALSDLEDKTHVWKIEKGQKATIDDEKRTVKIQQSSYNP